jgi:hypothetical protein
MCSCPGQPSLLLPSLCPRAPPPNESFLGAAVGGTALGFRRVKDGGPVGAAAAAPEREREGPAEELGRAASAGLLRRYMAMMAPTNSPRTPRKTVATAVAAMYLALMRIP